LLFDIRRACREVESFNEGGTREDYSSHTMRRAATERMFEIMGEAMTRLRDTDEATFQLFSQAHAIIGFRNRLIHGYDAVDDEIVWQVIREKTPVLLHEVQQLLDSAGEEP
jgi:uncharacterized protein with HEPN domain